MNIGNYHLYADIDDVERKFVIGKNKEEFSYIKQTGVANITDGELTKMAEKYLNVKSSPLQFSIGKCCQNPVYLWENRL